MTDASEARKKLRADIIAFISFWDQTDVLRGATRDALSGAVYCACEILRAIERALATEPSTDPFYRGPEAREQLRALLKQPDKRRILGDLMLIEDWSALTAEPDMDDMASQVAGAMYFIGVMALRGNMQAFGVHDLTDDEKTWLAAKIHKEISHIFGMKIANNQLEREAWGTLTNMVRERLEPSTEGLPGNRLSPAGPSQDSVETQEPDKPAAAPALDERAEIVKRLGDIAECSPGDCETCQGYIARAIAYIERQPTREPVRNILLAAMRASACFQMKELPRNLDRLDFEQVARNETARLFGDKT